MPGDKTNDVATVDFELATAEELAKIIGVDRATINRYLKRQILTSKSISDKKGKRNGRLFIISNALEEVRANLNMHSFRSGKSSAETKKASNPPKEKPPEKPEEKKDRRYKVEPASPLNNNMDRYNSAKAEHEELKVKLQRQKLDEQSKKLMDVERVKKTVYSYNSRVREAILNIPDQLGPELYASKSLFQLQERLRSGLNQALSNLDKLDKRIDKISSNDT